ncbi:uncharacterized protein LOC143044190 [Mytilus galloprovincialis]|uniref:uncharacterized protein LOC143044190 n=1 Tax=Mytilus galloprovincialis TaxID=29158 RepID=UPI003F7C0BE5
MTELIYKVLILLTLLTSEILAREVYMRNVSALLGTDDIDLRCFYTTDPVDTLVGVDFFAKNESSDTFADVVQVILLNYKLKLLPYGEYLFGSVNITTVLSEVVLSFNDLKCKHERSYRCGLNIYSEAPIYSEPIDIFVQVPPSKPDGVSLVHTQAASSVITTNIMDYNSSSPSTAVTSKENEVVSASPTDKQNHTTAMQTTGYDTISTPYPGDDVSFNVSYTATTYSSQQTTAEQVIAEGDNITVVCTGDVGKPPAEHIFQKYLRDHTLSMTYTPTETSLSDISENCTYNRTSNLTFQVTAEDNNAVIRCVVNSSLVVSALYVETDPIEVYYEVSIPTITKYPNEPYYVVGEHISILLTCKSDGNPKPNYQWYKDNMLINTNESLNITDMNVTNSGNFTCYVTNTFNGDTHSNAEHVQINIMNKDYTTRTTLKHSNTLADISTTKSSSIGSSSGVDKEEEKPEGNISLVIGTVVAMAVVTIIVVIIVIIACRRRKSKSPTSKNDDSKPKPVTEPRTGDYDYIALEDDAPTKGSNNGLEVEDITKHNAEYLKKQEEEEKKKNESNTPPQPAVYTQVNEATKSKNKPKTESTESTDKQEEDPYAETQEDVYDKAGNSRHKVNENVEHFDSLSSSKQNSNGDNKLSIQTSQVGSYANQGFEKDENRKVATVSPTVRSSSSSQNDEQTNSNRNSQSKKGYENIIGTDQTGISEEETSHRTAL